MKVLALSGSPRKGANSDYLTDMALKGASEAGAEVEKLLLRDFNIKPCKGCLRCNVMGYCSIKDDDFNYFKNKFLESDGLIISAPVYYHYIPGEMKILFDRFRSTLHVQLTPEKLNHTLKGSTRARKFLFILTLGHPETYDAIPALEALSLWARMTTEDHIILKPVIATFLAIPNQIKYSKEKLKELFQKMKIPVEIVDEKYELYQKFIKDSYSGGEKLVNG